MAPNHLFLPRWLVYLMCNKQAEITINHAWLLWLSNTVILQIPIMDHDSMIISSFLGRIISVKNRQNSAKSTSLSDTKGLETCCPCLIQDGVEFLLVLMWGSKFHVYSLPLEKFQKCQFREIHVWIIDHLLGIEKKKTVFGVLDMSIPVLSYPPIDNATFFFVAMATWSRRDSRGWFPVSWPNCLIPCNRKHV